MTWHPDGKKWSQREEMGGKSSPKRAKNSVLASNMVENGPSRT